MDCLHFFSTVLPNWLTAIGTIGAVITSLWFSYQSNKIKVKGSAQYMKKWILPFGLHRSEIALLKIVNKGKVPIIIQSVHVEFKPKNGRTSMLIPDPNFGLISAPLPARLEFSDEFTLQLEKNALEKILEENPNSKSIAFYAMTKLDERIELKNDPQLDDFIHNWKLKLTETQAKSEESV
ncbi:MAG: hypothetical protein MH321_03240 [Leptospiraceae bacterium]|nr:hypothetical protein [Leptospiraceae bacterium]